MANRTMNETMFPAQIESATAVRDFVDQACEHWGVERPAAYKLHLIVEELFTNTIKHGHRGRAGDDPWDWSVSVSLGCDAEQLWLRYSDQAPAFNPLAFVHSVDAASGAAEQKVGGLGVLLVCELSQHAEYAYVYGRNRVTLSVPRHAAV